MHETIIILLEYFHHNHIYSEVYSYSRLSFHSFIPCQVVIHLAQSLGEKLDSITSCTLPNARWYRWSANILFYQETYNATGPSMVRPPAGTSPAGLRLWSCVHWLRIY